MKVTTDGCLFAAWIASKIKNQPIKGKAVLDAGTGTGLLSLMLAQQDPDLIIDAIEIDKEAAKQAEENIAASPWKNSIHPIHSDIRVYPFSKKYDLIISNPPFYENELKSPDSKKNLAHHGNEFSLTELFSIARNQLTDTGNYYFLLPYKRKNEIQKLLLTHGLYIHEMALVKQSIAHDYFRLMICGGLKEKSPVLSNEISIRNDKEQYTTEFIQLLKEYYLKL
jgi:tRNA1Val (adenine37-N6)-methyltransferase